MDTMLHHLDRGDGRLAYTSHGTGPLVVLVPGMGDLRSTWRDLVGPLADAGHRVIALDLRGHGDSDATFAEHGLVPIAQDVLALLEHLDEPAVIIGNSVGAGAAAWVANARPDLVAGLVLIAAHLQDHGPVSTTARLQVSLLLRRPWGPAAWAWFYRSLNNGHQAPWLGEHIDALRASLRRPGRMEAFGALARSLVTETVDIPVPDIQAPALVLYGEGDKEFPDPAAELDWLVGRLPRAAGMLIPDSGHYPQGQRPDVVVPAVLGHVATLPRTGSAWASGAARA